MKPENNLKKMATVRLDPQMWNEGAYIGFAGTLENFAIERRIMWFVDFGSCAYSPLI